jgi:hypothetical protein
MITNLNKLRDSDPIDSSMYRKLIAYLMYLVDTKTDIFFVVKIVPGGT